MACDLPQLPKSYEYNFVYDNREVRIKEVSTAERVQEWIAELQELTGVIWKVETTFPRSGRVNIFRKHFRCHHNTRRKTDSRYRSKNTNCPAKMRIVVKRDYSDCPKSQLAKVNPDAKDWPCVVEFKGDHNHSLTSDEALRYHPLAPNARKKIVDLYRKGHTPSSAYKAFCSQVMCQLGSEYTSVLADRSVIPTKIDFQNIWVNDFKKHFGLMPKRKKEEDSAGEDALKDPDELRTISEENCQMELTPLPSLSLHSNQYNTVSSQQTELGTLQNPIQPHLDNSDNKFRSIKQASSIVIQGLHHNYTHNDLTVTTINHNSNTQPNAQSMNDHSELVTKPNTPVASETSEAIQLSGTNYQSTQLQPPNALNVQHCSLNNGANIRPQQSSNLLEASSHCVDTDESILCKLLQQKRTCVQPRQQHYATNSGSYDNGDDLQVLDYNLVIDSQCKAPTLSCCIQSEHLNQSLVGTASSSGTIQPIRHQVNQSAGSGIIIIPQSINEAGTRQSILNPLTNNSVASAQSGLDSQQHSITNCNLDVEGVLKEFDEVCAVIKESVKSDPINVIPAMRRFMNNFNTYVNSQSDLLQSLQMAFKPKKKRLVNRQEERS